MIKAQLIRLGDSLRRGLWRWRLRLGAAGLAALALAALAGGAAAVLAWQARADQAQEAQLRQALAQASDSLARQRQAEAQRAAQQQEQIKQAALAQAQAERPPAARPGMRMDARAGDEFVDPEQAPQGAGLAAAPAVPATPPVLPPGTAPARVLLARLPPLAQRDDDLALVLALAREAGLANARAQYRRLEPRSTGIQRLEITLAANEDFEAWRRLMVGVLNRLPHAAVSGAAWSRPQAEGGATEARMGFVLYHRTGAVQ
ncbi:hypothetical protein BurJ1DRAFT_0020 [Burkholderiales bacterium JOSHI_001]|nr:hypothetical protein BurJ1DRAFT_0020 [Burkholderiales bacterium JOSHI_001]